MKKDKFINGINQTDVVKVLRPSPLYAFASVFPMLVIAGVSLYFAVTISKLIVFVSLISIFVAAYRYLYINLIRYTITKQTIMARTGIIARKFDNLELFRVKDYIVSQSVFERIFSLMTINLHTTDLSDPNLRMAGVPLSNITEIIRDLVQEARLNNQIFEIN